MFHRGNKGVFLPFVKNYLFYGNYDSANTIKVHCSVRRRLCFVSAKVTFVIRYFFILTMTDFWLFFGTGCANQTSFLANTVD